MARRNPELARTMRLSGGMHSHAFEMAVYYITHVARQVLTPNDSLKPYHFKYVAWCVRRHLPWGMTGECVGFPRSHRYRQECILMPKKDDDPVILTPEGLKRIRWTLNYYREHPAPPWLPDDTLYGRTPSGRASLCERCANADDCWWAPVYGWHGHCKIERFKEKK